MGERHDIIIRNVPEDGWGRFLSSWALRNARAYIKEPQNWETSGPRYGALYTRKLDGKQWGLLVYHTETATVIARILAPEPEGGTDG